jgi:hypothetical protein
VHRLIITRELTVRVDQLVIGEPSFAAGSRLKRCSVAVLRSMLRSSSTLMPRLIVHP